ncbi:hypothetical protein GCM10010112_65130 [Actinoplanes lobatus]|nr:hypothetical protein GCM10010112_65130 [Actinoplanes lobatus]
MPGDQRATEIIAEALPGAVPGEIERWNAIFGDAAPGWVTRLITAGTGVGVAITAFRL